MVIDFQTDPSRYRHWRIEIDGSVARLVLDVHETGGLFNGYDLKLNSYDLGVDIELHDAILRLRFEHPTVKAVILTSLRDRVFCAGANIRMLAGADHGHKVNFCKFTNETRQAMEDASAQSGQRYIAAVDGACAGGGYELALATDHIMLVDDGSTSVSLPEVALLAVLPGTGGVTRLTDKRRIRRDRADLFCASEEGARGKRALEWGLVDELVPASRFADAVTHCARKSALLSDRPDDATGVVLRPLDRRIQSESITYSSVTVTIDRAGAQARIEIAGPEHPAPEGFAAVTALGDAFWPLRLARELDDALLHLRFNEPGIGVLSIASRGDPGSVLAHDTLLHRWSEDWLLREVRLLWTRVMNRLDLTARSLFTLIEPESCFAGFLAELVFAADRSYMADGAFEAGDGREARLVLSPANFGNHPMLNGLSRLETRFLGDPAALEAAIAASGLAIDAAGAESLGLVTAAFEEIDWADELRLIIEERASFSPDALTALEANTRFAGPETMQTKIFGRLTAWQNWIFQRPNAVGEAGSLKRYGTGQPAVFDRNRI